MDLQGPDFSDCRDQIFSDSRDPTFNSRDPNRVLKRLKKTLPKPKSLNLKEVTADTPGLKQFK